MAAEDWSTAPVPAQTVAAVREAITPLTDDVLAAVRAENPAYADVLGSPEGMGIRLGIEQAIKAFLDAIERGERPPADAGEVWRRLGEAEFQAGRGLDSLRAAFRTGTRAVWRGAAILAAAADVSTTEVVALAEGIFVYADELAADVVEGYLQMQSDEAGERERRRRRLATLLLDADDHDPEAIERAAALARWPIPHALAVVAFNAEAPLGAARLDIDMLPGADELGAWLVIPDPDGPGRSAKLRRALDGVPSALGPTVAPGDAPRSLRWARLTLALLERGALAPGAPPTRTAQHLGTLMLLQDQELAQAIVSSRLGALDALAAPERERLLETLAAWLDHQRHTPRIAEQLHVHPQTVRYRVGKLRELLGDALDTPAGRFELGLAIRARQALRE